MSEDVDWVAPVEEWEIDENVAWSGEPYVTSRYGVGKYDVGLYSKGRAYSAWVEINGGGTWLTE